MVDELLRTASEKKQREREEIEEELLRNKKKHDRERDRQLTHEMFRGLPPRPDPPFLPPRRAHTKEYTLVLDLDETLIHFNEVSVQVSTPCS